MKRLKECWTFITIEAWSSSQVTRCISILRSIVLVTCALYCELYKVDQSIEHKLKVLGFHHSQTCPRQLAQNYKPSPNDQFLYLRQPEELPPVTD